ncbi:hypothetical protein [Amycolatopsis sp. NPDC051102]|uniref:hypothetical protein n=1 Tax=Amycolatopsis sp. NPDC051102 TaxID=3155163 RepID=UPI003417CB3B
MRRTTGSRASAPRALAWVTPETSEADRAFVGTPRVHAIEYGWLASMGNAAARPSELHA